jgi:hypothetical protein
MRRTVVVLCLVASVARGQSPKALFEEGTALYDAAQFEQAALKFEASYELRPVPVTKFNAAKSWELAGKTLNAIAAWQAYLPMSPSEGQRVEARAALKGLGEKLAKMGLQALTITSLPLKASITIDGVPRGQAPVTVELPASKHVVRVELEGREPIERYLDFTLEQPRLEAFDLLPLGSQPAPVPLPFAPTALPPPTIPSVTDPTFAQRLGNDVVQVHIDTEEPEVRLYRANGNPNGECRTPCDVPITRATDDFYVGGKGLSPSSSFVLVDHQRAGRANLIVKPGSALAAVGLGTVLTSLGIGLTVLGAVFTFSSVSGDKLLPVIGLVGGIGLIVGGILSITGNQTTVTFAN